MCLAWRFSASAGSTRPVSEARTSKPARARATYICICVYMCVCTYVYVCMYVCVYIYICIYICIVYALYVPGPPSNDSNSNDDAS